MARRELRDAQWTPIKELLPGTASDPGRTATATRTCVDAVRWIARTGAHWRELPDSVGAGNRVFQRENRWAKAGVWERIFQPLSDDPDCEDVLMDSTLVRAHQPRAGANGGREALGRSNGGLPTTLHTAGDAGGNPVRFLLTPGPASEYTQAAPLLTGFPAHQGLADQGDDRQKIVDAGEKTGAQAVIPPRSHLKNPRAGDVALYAERDRIEGFFNTLKHDRGVATRSCTRARNVAALIYLAAALIWMK